MGIFGGGGGSSNKEAGIARRDEQRRQERIRAGTGRIDAIFDGGKYLEQVTPTNHLFDTSRGDYVDINGKRIKNPIKKFDEENVFTKERAPGQFGDAFYKGRRQSYIDYATPQLDQQHDDANRELTFSLARSGNLQSSARADLASRLQQKYELNKQNIKDQGLSYETQARSAVEDARANLITTLSATGDVEGAANAAIARSKALSQPAAYSPLTQLFTDFTGTLGTQYAQDRSAALGGTTAGGGVSLNPISSGAVKVTR